MVTNNELLMEHSIDHDEVIQTLNTKCNELIPQPKKYIMFCLFIKNIILINLLLTINFM